MPTDFEKFAADMLRGKTGADIEAKSDALRSLSETQDAKKIKQMLGDGSSVKNAMKSGDTAALESIVKNVLSTKEGARLAEEISKMFK